MKVFPEKINIWISRWSGECLPLHSHQYGLTTCNPLRAWTEQKVRGRVNSISLLELGHSSSSVLLVHRPSDSDWIIPLTFLLLQLANNMMWHICFHNYVSQFHNKYFLIYSYVAYWFYLPGEPWLIHRLTAPYRKFGFPKIGVPFL